MLRTYSCCWYKNQRGSQSLTHCLSLALILFLPGLIYFAQKVKLSAQRRIGHIFILFMNSKQLWESFYQDCFRPLKHEKHINVFAHF